MDTTGSLDDFFFHKRERKMGREGGCASNYKIMSSSYLLVAVSPPLPLSSHDSFGTGQDPDNLVIFRIAMDWHVLKILAQISTVPDKLHNWKAQRFSEVRSLLLACS